MRWSGLAPEAAVDTPPAAETLNLGRSRNMRAWVLEPVPVNLSFSALEGRRKARVWEHGQRDVRGIGRRLQGCRPIKDEEAMEFKAVTLKKSHFFSIKARRTDRIDFFFDDDDILPLT